MKPVDILKKDLKKLQDETSAWKVTLQAALKANQPISQADEEWLDGDGNLVNEERVVSQIENALDYDCAVESLNLQDKSIVQKLVKLGDKKGISPTAK
ncbi:hypothetical protein JVU11DRAFT_11754 [Chiua virens]|nr:hypothetical protein JVU11DRAFT_11754 [Chiua virens]